MPRANRVTPFGVLEASTERGARFGNRGRLTNDRGAVVRRWQGERWICCVLEFRDRRHPLDDPRRYTGLFFRDEATALAAGHRPCRECRRRDADAFHAAWRTIHPRDERLTHLDARLHRERVTGVHVTARTTDLPAGAVVALDGRAWVVTADGLRPWSHGRLGRRTPAPAHAVTVLTPPTTIAVLRTGWTPSDQQLVR